MDMKRGAEQRFFEVAFMAPPQFFFSSQLRKLLARLAPSAGADVLVGIPYPEVLALTFDTRFLRVQA